MIQVDTLISRKDFIRFSFSTVFKKPIMKLLFGFYFFVLVITLFSLVMSSINNYASEGDLDYFSWLILPGLGILFFWSIYHNSKKAYDSSTSLKEPISYTFSESGIHSEGNSFKGDLYWNAIHKVEETDKWFIFYQSNNAGTIVPQAAFESQEKVIALRELIASQPNVKHKLKKE